MNTKDLCIFAACDLTNEDVPKQLRYAFMEIISAIEAVDDLCHGLREHKDIMPAHALSVAADFKLDIISYMAKLSTLALCNLYEKTKGK